MYWEKDEKRKSKVCEWMEETWEQVQDGCMREEDERDGWQRNVEEILGEEGLEEKWMKKVEKAKGVKEDEWENVGVENRKHERDGQEVKGKTEVT